MTGHEARDWKLIEGNRYWREVQDIWSEINTLKEGRYYENEIHHRPGVPRIETAMASTKTVGWS